jgi:hypothetical protein
MGGLGIWLRADAPKRWRGWLAIAVIAGVGWGAVLAGAAGARRTQSAFPRFVEYSNAPTALVGPEEAGYKGFDDEVSRMPQVVSAGPLVGINAYVSRPKPPTGFSFGAPFLPVDNRFGRTFDRPKVLRGRLPDPNRADEVLVSPSFAKGLHLDVGSSFTMQLAISGAPGVPPSLGKALDVRIAGIGVTQNEAFPITVFDRVNPLVLLTNAAFRAYFDPAFVAFDAVLVRLRPGASIATFQEDVNKVLARHPEAGSTVFISSENYRPAIVARAIRPQVIALEAFAAVLAITLILVMIQTITRQILIQGADHETLRALGFTPRQLVGLAIIPAGLAALAGAVIAVGVAIAASPLTPIGAARVAEPTPGVAVDLPVLAIGAAVLALVLVGAALLPAWRASRFHAAPDGTDASSQRGRSRIAEGLGRLGMPAPMTTGVRMALEPGRGRSAVPVRTVLIGAFVSMAALSAAFTFGASVGHAVSDPTLSGQRWDRMVDAQFEAVPVKPLDLVKDPSYEAVAGGVHSAGLLVVNHRAIPAIAIDQLKGSIFPTLLEGRAPRTANEIVLGTTSMRQSGAHVGGTVSVELGSVPKPMRVVGRAVFPSFGIGAFTPTGLGEGAALTVAGLGGSYFLQPGDYSFLLVRFAPHPTAAAVRRIDTACKPIDVSGDLCLRFRRQPPPEISSYAQVRNVPWLLAGLLGALAAATLTHGLLATVRRRRRDLAVLKTLGFVRRQISTAVAWQASTLLGVALVGIPLGVAAGRWAWTALAEQLGILPQPRVPMLTIALTIPASLLFAVIVAVLPALSASRTKAALVLRTE